MRGEERNDAVPQGAGFVLEPRESVPALPQRDVGPVVIAGEPQPSIKRSVERLRVEVHPPRDVAEPPAFALESGAKVLALPFRFPAAAEIVLVLSGRPELAVEQVKTLRDPLPLPGLRPFEAEPTVALLRLEALTGACPGAAKQEKEVDEREHGGSEERVRGGMEEQSRRDGARDPGRGKHQQRRRPSGRRTRNIRCRQPMQELTSRLVDPLGVGHRFRPAGKAAELRVELAELGRNQADRVESLIHLVDRLRPEANALAGLATELHSRPVTRRSLLLHASPLARELALEVLQPGDPGAHVGGRPFVEPAPRKPGRGERVFGGAALGLGAGEVLLHAAPLAPEAFQRLGLLAGQPLQT